MTLQHLSDIRHGAIFQLFGSHSTHGANQIRFLSRTVTHNHNFIQGIVVLGQNDIQRAVSIRANVLLLEPDIRNLDHGIVSDTQAETSVNVGQRAVFGTFFIDACPDNGISMTVFHGSADASPVALHTT